MERYAMMNKVIKVLYIAAFKIFDYCYFGSGVWLNNGCKEPPVVSSEILHSQAIEWEIKGRHVKFWTNVWRAIDVPARHWNNK